MFYIVGDVFYSVNNIIFVPKPALSARRGGPKGSGKSTLLSLVAWRLASESGARRSAARTFARQPGAALRESLREDDFLRRERAALETNLRRLERDRIRSVLDVSGGGGSP